MIQRLSVNLLLKSVILTLSAAIVVVLSLGAWNSWHRQATVRRIAGVVETSASFFTALHNLRSDRTTTVRELIADRVNSTLPAQLVKLREIDLPALKAGLASLETVDFPGRAAAVASLGLTNTGTDSAAEWSPDHVGEPEEDFPGFTAVHDLILRPIGISAPRQPLPGDRATFYVPATFWRGFTTDPRSGRRLMYMRDLACCAGRMAFYSTPSDLVRFALATNADSVNGELAGGSVMSLMTRRDNGIVVAVASNIAHANTAALALKVADTFAEQK